MSRLEAFKGANLDLVYPIEPKQAQPRRAVFCLLANTIVSMPENQIQNCSPEMGMKLRQLVGNSFGSSVLLGTSDEASKRI